MTDRLRGGVSGMLGGPLWHHANFRRLWIGDTVSQFGSQVTGLALPLLAVQTLQASTFEVGLLTTFETLAFLLVGLPAGAWVDRMRMRSVLIVNDLLRALFLASLPIAWWLGILTIGQLFVVAVVFGVCTVFFDVAYQSYLPSLVDREHLVEGNSKLEASRAVAQVAGPGLGGLLVGWLRPVVAVLVDALSFLWSAYWVHRIDVRPPKAPRSADRDLVKEIREGLSFVLTHRLLRAIALCTGTSNLFSTIAGSMAILLLARELGLSAATIGVVFSIAAVGGFVGVAVTGPLTRRLGQGPTIVASAFLFAVPGFVAPFVERGWSVWLYAGAMAAASAFVVAYNITQVSFRQGLCPPRLLGRMNASMRFLVWGTMPLGGLIAGVLGAWIGVRPTLLVAAIGAMLAFLPVYLSPLRRMRDLPSYAGED